VERPLQVVLKEREVDFFYTDIRGLASGAEKDEFINTYKANDRKRLFDLGRDVLMRVAIIRLAELEYIFIRSNHHILMDGWCRGILNSDFFEIYGCLVNGRQPRLSPVKPYRIFVEWLERQEKEEARNYWKQFLSGYDEAVIIPKKVIDERSVRQYNREEYMFEVTGETPAALKQMAVTNNVTVSVILQAIWGILLSNYNNRRDVVFGVVVSGRPAEIDGVESMVGLFINTIPVRVRFNSDTTFSQLIRQLQGQTLESEPYQYSSLAEIQAESLLKQHLMDHFLTFLNYPAEGFIINDGSGRLRLGEKSGLEVSGIVSLERSNYNLDVLIDFSERFTIKLRYNTNVYESNFMKNKLAVHIVEVIDQVVQNDSVNVQDIVISHDRLAANPNIPIDDGGDFDL
jgi:iturin family lipopeptide synthetase B/iturin family lipopeptide synthetase C